VEVESPRIEQRVSAVAAAVSGRVPEVEAMRIARDCGLLVLVHAENGDAIAKLQAQALARGDTEPRWAGLTRLPAAGYSSSWACRSGPMSG
jgi:hypothetical protein